MDNHKESASSEGTITMEALSTAETVASPGSTKSAPATAHGPAARKVVWIEGSCPKIDSWLQDQSRPCNHPSLGVVPDKPAISFSALPEKCTAPSRAPSFRRQPPTGPRSTYATVLAGKNRATVANIHAGFPGPGPQPLRGIPGFPGQQAPQARAAPLGSGRLPNGKIGARSI